jgi:hypothetical protein
MARAARTTVAGSSNRIHEAVTAVGRGSDEGSQVVRDASAYRPAMTGAGWREMAFWSCGSAPMVGGDQRRRDNLGDDTPGRALQLWAAGDRPYWGPSGGEGAGGADVRELRKPSPNRGAGCARRRDPRRRRVAGVAVGQHGLLSMPAA